MKLKKICIREIDKNDSNTRWLWTVLKWESSMYFYDSNDNSMKICDTENGFYYKIASGYKPTCRLAAQEAHNFYHQCS